MAPITLIVYCPEDDTYLVVREGSYEILDLSNSIEVLRNQIHKSKYLGSLKYCLDHYDGPLELGPLQTYIQEYINSKNNTNIHRVGVKDGMLILRHPGSTWGFVKGSATEGEKEKRTAIREFYEEMRTIIPEEELVPLTPKNNVFQWTIDGKKRDEIMDNFYEGFHQSSEVYNPIFVTKEEMLEADRAMFELNPIRQGFKEGFIIDKHKERYNAVRMNTVSYNAMDFPPRKTRTVVG